MRSPDVLASLIGKELRDLSASRAYWLTLLITGALVGHAFMDATSLYAEVSGGGGGPSALSQGLSPLTGIVVPTLGAYDLVSTLLFPFVVIRTFAAERESGAWRLMLQAPANVATVVASKAIALMLAWFIALVPGLAALTWWHVMGGHLNGAETLVVVLGYVMRGLLTIGIGAAAGALAAHTSSAAIVALSVTLGAWAIDYAAAAKGGWFQELARYTPESALRVFEQGELRMSVVLVMTATSIAGLAIAWQWMRTGLAFMRRAAGVAGALVVFLLVALAVSRIRDSRDLSEDRRNSFSEGDERALHAITSPLTIRVNLAAEDPRLSDLERGVFAKLRRTLPSVDVEYVAKGRSGLFAGTGDHYGEVWYEMAGKRLMSRSSTEEIVLETIYSLAGITVPTLSGGASYTGYPFSVLPRHASLVFFLVWPLLVLAVWWRTQREPQRDEIHI